MKILIIIVLCLSPSLAFAEETLLKFKDGSAPMCGNYTEKGNQYCKSVGGGDVCWQKSDIKSVTKVEECEEGGFSAGGAGSGSSSSASAVSNKDGDPHRFDETRKKEKERYEEAVRKYQPR